MLQEKIATQHVVVCLPGFFDQGVAASQTDVQLPLPGGGTGYVMPCSGYVIGLTASLTAAASAGSLTIGVTIDGTESTVTTQTVTTQQEVRALFDTARGIAFQAGQQIGVEITTDASWNGITSNLDAQVYVVLTNWEF